MTEKLSPEVRQAVRDTVYAFQHEQLGGDPDTFVRAVEKRLEPKHPPKGTICEVWDNVAPRTPRYADGNGEFVEYRGNALETWDHYRVIPTAKDALAVIETHGFHNGNSETWRVVKHLIDNAMEG